MTFYQHTHQGGQVLKRVESTEYPRATTFVYTQEYPWTLTKDGLGQMSRLNAQCLHMTEQAECKVHRHYMYVYILQ